MVGRLADGSSADPETLTTSAMLPGGLLPGVGGRGGGLCLVRWLGLRMWSRRGTLVFALLWFGSWVFLNGLVLVHRSILSDYCTDDKSKRILQRLVSHIVFTGVSGLGSFVFICSRTLVLVLTVVKQSGPVPSGSAHWKP